jgi:hypothetical protein
MRNVCSQSCTSRLAFLLLAGLAVAGIATSPASAETKTFFVENQPDGYGIDQCLATGAECGKPMASLYCQSHQYDEAVSFHKADPVEVLKVAGDAASSASGSKVAFVAIECQR